MKVDVEKLICFLMSDEVIENNIPESLKLGLEQQGLKCKDGKIHSISEKERSKKPPYPLEIRNGNVYFCYRAMRGFTEGKEYSCKKDYFLTNDYGNEVTGLGNDNFCLAEDKDLYYHNKGNA